MMRRTSLKWLAVIPFALAPSAARAVEWQDNAFRYWYGPAFSEPGIGAHGESTSVAKQVISFTHADGYKFGGNFLNIDLLISNSKDPVNNNSNLGATELYAVYRHSIGLNKVSGSQIFAFGPVRDLLIVGGGDINTKNTAFAPSKVMPVLGAQLSMAVPGFWVIGALANKEWNSNGFFSHGTAGGGTVTFDVTVMFASAWGVPIGSTGLSFEGFALANLPKGKDGFGGDTKTEVLLHPKVMFDVGTLWGSKGFQLGAGYEYWLNKFGCDHDKTLGCLQSTAFLEAAVHL